MGTIALVVLLRPLYPQQRIDRLAISPLGYKLTKKLDQVHVTPSHGPLHKVRHRTVRLCALKVFSRFYKSLICLNPTTDRAIWNIFTSGIAPGTGATCR